MKTQSYAIPNALAVTTASVFVLCAILVGLFPDISFSIAGSWFHGIGFSKAALNITISSFILGLVSSTITSWINEKGFKIA
ncbi:hypothetical protein HYW41_00520 [Candidatus Daviesbacteria bacterium]|nr:hypothetical protein [Candidatus Daviesbacteria bacterium]